MSRMRRRTLLTIAAALGSGLIFSGCGTSAPADTSGAGSEGRAVTITGTDGKEVTLPDGPAHRVVALEWEHAEMLTSVGAGDAVAGLTDVKGYDDFVAPTVPLTSEPADVGQRIEPSVEAIAKIAPDLIVASPRSIPSDVEDQISAIAPVLELRTDDPDDPLGQLKHATTVLGQATGNEQNAKSRINDFDKHLDDVADEISQADPEESPAVFAAVIARGGHLQLRLHGKGSAPDAVLEALGMPAAYTGDVDKSGLGYTDIEGLTQLPDDTQFLYWHDSADGGDPVETDLAGNSVWDGLPFVKSGHTHGVAKGIWVYGGLESMAAFADDVATTMTSK